MASDRMRMIISWIAAAILAVITAASGFAAVSVSDAQTAAGPYIFINEQPNMAPQMQVYGGSSLYWVFEIKRVGQLMAMIPVNVDTGLVESDESVKDALKTHYVANFFKENNLDQVLSAVSDFASSTKYSLNGKLEMLNSDVKPYVNKTVYDSFTKLGAFESTINSASEYADNLMDKVSEIRLKLTLITTIDGASVSDIDSLASSFSSMFSSENSLLESISYAADASTEFKTEVNEKHAAGELTSDERSLLINVFLDSVSLENSVDVKSAEMDSNKVIVDSIFDGLDTKVSQFYSTLIERIENGEDARERADIQIKLMNYSGQYGILQENITEKEIPDTYSGIKSKMDELWDLINQSLSNCDADKNVTLCLAVKLKYDDIESGIDEIKGIITNYIPEGCDITCDSGYALNTSTCLCDPVVVKPAGGINMTYVIIAIALIAVLVLFKYKGKLFPASPSKKAGQTGSSSYDPWSKYQFK
ncbi:MAG: hypothetical protein V1911_03560 [Candidatus Micrarchaeota archaeon]